MNRLSRTVDALLHPTVRLDADFPLTGAKLGKSYGIGLLLFFAGSFLPLAVLLGYVFGAIKFCSPTTAVKLLEPLFNTRTGQLTESTMIVLMLSSFLTGFCLELGYFSRVLRRSGHSLRRSVGLSLANVSGDTTLKKLWSIAWRVAVCFAAWHLFETGIGKIAHPPAQPTVVWAQSLTGGHIWLFFLMAAVLAPVFEEIVFRGFLFQALRTTFHNWRKQADGTAAVKPGWGSRITSKLGATLFATSNRADLGAVFLSAAFFSVEHLQFQPVTMLLLFLMGALLAELFRRTGTLWAGILLHATNNAVATLLIIAAMH